MKYQALFYQKSNKKYSQLSSAAVVIGTLMVSSNIKISNKNSAKGYVVPG